MELRFIVSIPSTNNHKKKMIKEWGKEIIDFLERYWSIIIGMGMFGLIFYFLTT